MDSNNLDNSRTIVGAVTYPNEHSPNDVPLPVQPRHPVNLQGVLRFATELTKTEDARSTSNLEPMDEERRTLIEEVLRSMTVDVAHAKQKCIEILSNSETIHSIKIEDELPEEVKTAFNRLLEIIDDIDIANNFYKMGGFSIFPVCYGSENDTVRAMTSSLLAQLCQNNPFCQSKALEQGLLKVLLNLAQFGRGDALVKSLYAISCSTREFEPACLQLIELNGCNILAQQLSAPEPSARTKAAFLIRYLCSNYSNAKVQFIRLNPIATITELIRSGHDDTTEHLLSVLMVLVEDLDDIVLNQCRDPNIRLRKTLEDHLKLLEEEGDRYTEEIEYCAGILSKVFEKLHDSVQEVADR